ncbi:Hypothetical predicted protein, partial [Scomber scombrus]
TAEPDQCPSDQVYTQRPDPDPHQEVVVEAFSESQQGGGAPLGVRRSGGPGPFGTRTAPEDKHRSADQQL